MASINKITVGGVAYDITIPSGLSEEVQKQIRDNIGALSEADVNVVADGTYPEMTVGTAYNAQNDGNGDNIAKTYVKLNELLNKVYPVESVYISTGATSPASIFGGTWTQIEGRFLLGAGGVYALGSTGGAESSEHAHDAGDLFAKVLPDENTKITFKTRSTPTWDSNTTMVDLTRQQIIKPGISYGTEVSGSTASKNINNLPPYLAVNIWKRIA